MLKRIRALISRRGKRSADGTAADLSDLPRPPVHHGPRVVHQPISTADLDPDAVKIVRRLTRFDHRAYFVGGCVRDLLLDHKPKDFDIGTSATPRQIKRLFRNCRIIGRRFRLAHIYFQNGKIIEVATFRSREGPDTTEDDDDLLIRDDNVFGTLEEDALRRDFTINSLFYDLNEQNVLDHADGLNDLRHKLVRTIGDPDVRFREDPIRILRAIKFAARLGLEIEAGTKESLIRTRGELDKAATPRVLEEINRFCRGAAARRSFELMQQTRVFETVFPELAGQYKRSPKASELMLALLGRMDTERGKDEREIRTGEIFAAILLPLLAPKVGWNTDGSVSPPRGLNLRGLIDEMLRPVALRLRVPRREQEYCRQILGTLFRMVPTQRLRRNVRQAVLKRECLPDSLWMLAELAECLGNDFTEAYEYWTADKQRRSAREATRAQEAEDRPSRSSARRGGRRRSRRGGGGGNREQGRSEEPRQGVPPVDHAKPHDMPPPWDDDYFFAALPSAPEDAGDDAKGDRYGASAVAPPAPAVPSEESQATPGDRPKRKRRRRRRRPRPEGTQDSTEAGGEESGKAKTEE